MAPRPTIVQPSGRMPDLDQRYGRECGTRRFFLDPNDVAGLNRHLRELGWLDDDRALEAERIGDGNMNLTVRVRTGRRSVVLKQARPWVEKYPSIAAPLNRSRVEAAFYRAVAAEPSVSARMPALLGADEDSRLIMLEDLGDAADLTPLYSGARLEVEDADALVEYLKALHAVDVDASFREVFENREMRALNHAHQYEIPLDSGNGVDADRFTPGLAAEAEELRRDRKYRSAVEQVGRAYLADGPILAHGDYFPGSWLKNARRLFVIDPEFCFLGCAEYDLGVLCAHLFFAGREGLIARVREAYSGALDWGLAFRFAGAELMRRLIGVAQLPLAADLGRKRAWLDVSRELLCA